MGAVDSRRMTAWAERSSGRTVASRGTRVSNADDSSQKAEFDRELEQFERTRNIRPSKLVEQGGAETETKTERWTLYDESGPRCTHGTLTLKSNGHFELDVQYSEAAGWAGGQSVQGDWTREGAEIHFVVRERSNDSVSSQQRPATVRGDTIEIPGWGTFERKP
jgi:hypothetical protein